MPGLGNEIQDKPETSCHTRKKVIKTKQCMSKSLKSHWVNSNWPKIGPFEHSIRIIITVDWKSFKSVLPWMLPQSRTWDKELDTDSLLERWFQIREWGNKSEKGKQWIKCTLMSWRHSHNLCIIFLRIVLLREGEAAPHLLKVVFF